MEKKCYICDTIKLIDEFYKNQTRCKSCTKQYAIDNKNRIKEYKKFYRSENKEFLSEQDKKYYNNNKELIREKQKEYYLTNKEQIQEIQKNYRDGNIESVVIKNRESSKNYKIRKSSDLLWVLSNSVRSTINTSFKNKKYSKNSKSNDILGCSFDEFKIYLESKFEPWMNWNNKGLYNGEFNYGWDIDHIIPISSAKSEEEVLLLNHFTNLQPLCSYTNRHIKMNKINFYEK